MPMRPPGRGRRRTHRLSRLPRLLAHPAGLSSTACGWRNPAPAAQGADVIARAVTLAALAVIHVVDLPGTLGPIPLVGPPRGGWQAGRHRAVTAVKSRLEIE
jgi:hypothetical protein